MAVNVFRRVGAAVAALFSIKELRLHLRESLEDTDNDNYILSLARAAVENLEDRLSRAIVTREWELVMNAFPNVVRITVVPLATVTKIEYRSENGGLVEMPDTDYFVEPNVEPGLVYPKAGWPTTQARPDAVRITFTAGYGTPDKVPDALKHAILLAVKDMYDNRGAATTGNPTTFKFADHLIDPYYTLEV